MAARAGLLEAVLKPITTAGQVSGILDVRHRRPPPRARAARLLVARPTHHTSPITPSPNPQIKDLKQGIAAFYDESSALWEDVWGSEHMHHGYYPPMGGSGGSNGATATATTTSTTTQQQPKQPADDAQAQVDMIDRVLEWAGVTSTTDTPSPSPPKTMLDVGCGVGGSSRHVARLFPDLKTEGVTLSPFQAERAARLSERAGLGDRCRFRVADALDAPFPDASFDLVWSLESGEHMPGKPRFVRELARLTAPGGRIILVTWCHRDLLPGETSLRPEEQALLDRICEAYYLPPWCPPSEYARLMAENGLTQIRSDDWSDAVAPFWGAVIRKALTPRGVAGLFGAGWQTIKGALVMPLMARGLAMGTVRFALVTAVKPPVL